MKHIAYRKFECNQRKNFHSSLQSVVYHLYHLLSNIHNVSLIYISDSIAILVIPPCIALRTIDESLRPQAAHFFAISVTWKARKSYTDKSHHILKKTGKYLITLLPSTNFVLD